MSGSTGRGLRGGSYPVRRGRTTTTIAFHGARFAADLATAGRASIDNATNTVDATVVVARGGRRVATLAIHTVLWDNTHPTARIRGRVDGRRVALLAPTY